MCRSLLHASPALTIALLRCVPVMKGQIVLSADGATPAYSQTQRALVSGVRNSNLFSAPQSDRMPKVLSSL
jgi:hypothetical protein